MIESKFYLQLKKVHIHLIVYMYTYTIAKCIVEVLTCLAVSICELRFLHINTIRIFSIGHV